MEQNHPHAAYDLLAPLETEQAGDPEYDYLLGVAALEGGLSTEAIFALERVLAAQPNNVRARAQIARAYFAVGEKETSKLEFEKVRQQPISPEVRETIDRYLDAIGKSAGGDGFKARFFVEFSLGWDSNVNSATAIDKVAIPAFGNLVSPLAPGSTQRGDGFFGASAGIILENPLSDSFNVVAGLSADKHNNFNQDDFSTGALDGYLGVARHDGRNTWTLLGEANLFFLDNPALNFEYRDALGGTLQWSRDIDARNQVTAYGQYSALTYPEQDFLDAERYIAGAGYAHAFGDGRLAMYAGVYGGSERTRDPDFDYFSYRMLGVRFGGQKTLSESCILFVAGSGEWRDHRAQDPDFLLTRADRQYTAAAGLIFGLANQWKVSPQISYLTNLSNIPIDTYHQTVLYVTLRRDF